MHLSISNGDHTSKYFRFADVSGDDLYRHLCNYQWSPIVWKDGTRAKANFQYSTAMVLDFDDGDWTIEKACQWADSFRFKYICGTTRSHQKEKSGKTPCDRFRMLIPWTAHVLDLYSHEKNMGAIGRHVPTDKACFDGARSYRPFVEICRIVDDGRSISPKLFEPSKHKPVYLLRSNIPAWVTEVLANGAPNGQRNGTCFRVAANLVKCGLPDGQIEQMIIDSNIELSEGEKRNAARSGIRAGHRGATS